MEAGRTYILIRNDGALVTSWIQGLTVELKESSIRLERLCRDWIGEL